MAKIEGNRMELSKTHEKWKAYLLGKQLKDIYNIIDQFINESKIKGNTGIFLEHSKISRIIKKSSHSQQENDIISRYTETAYLIWALCHVHKRKDILNANIDNWGNGCDNGMGSNFRNFEFECHIALRFIECNCNIKALKNSGQPEFIIDDDFVIECKRPTCLEGIFKNTLKAEKQIATSGKKGFLIFNVDDLDEFKTVRTEYDIDKKMKKISNISEYGLKTDILGVIFEYVSKDAKIGKDGSFVYGLQTVCNSQLENLFIKVSMAINGDDSINFHPCLIDPNTRYKKEYNNKDKTEMNKFYKNLLGLRISN